MPCQELARDAVKGRIHGVFKVHFECANRYLIPTISNYQFKAYRTVFCVGIGAEAP